MNVGGVIVTHYRLGEEFLHALRLIVPDARNFHAVSIDPGQSVDEMRGSIEKALSEAHRVLKRGGRFLCLEFSSVDLPGLEQAYKMFSDRFIPPMGRVVTGDAQPYQYLVESIRKFPSPDQFLAMIAKAGFKRVTHSAFTGNIAALHGAWKL